MAYHPQIHLRKSIRLQEYDYSQAGLYFITICVQDRLCLFGEISNAPDMILNEAGKMVEKWYSELPNKFPDIQCHEMVVMPNHIHCILENTGLKPVIERGNVILGEHPGSPLHRVVQWFKTMTTNEYIRGVKQGGWPLFRGKLWQRNYWEHIIRSEQSYRAIEAYINNNPASWRNDQLYQHNLTSL